MINKSFVHTIFKLINGLNQQQYIPSKTNVDEDSEQNQDDNNTNRKAEYAYCFWTEFEEMIDW